MKVLLVNGSPRKEGNTFTALQELARTLESEGLETEILQLGNKPVRGCIGCGVCKKKANGRCTFDDDVCNQLCSAAILPMPLSLAAPYIMASPTVLYWLWCSAPFSPTEATSPTSLSPQWPFAAGEAPQRPSAQ